VDQAERHPCLFSAIDRFVFLGFQEFSARVAEMVDGLSSSASPSCRKPDFRFPVLLFRSLLKQP
jgi:hypothetical protein